MPDVIYEFPAHCKCGSHRLLVVTTAKDPIVRHGVVQTYNREEGKLVSYRTVQTVRCKCADCGQRVNKRQYLDPVIETLN